MTGIKLRSAGQCGRRSCLWKKPKTSDGLDALREVMSLRDIADYIDPASKQMLDARKNLSQSREARTKHVYTDPYSSRPSRRWSMAIPARCGSTQRGMS